ncbi:hypothetical protein EV363DRAFT_1258471 [Boletus edulis]|nr:hypothetical protein EV363DRAFT_1258471 [Boletus edulis]
MLASNSAPRAFSWQGVVLVATFLVLWMLAETIRRDERRQPQAHQDYLDFAASDLIKLVLSLSMWFLCRQLQAVPSFSNFISETHADTCNLPFQEYPQAESVSGSYFSWREPYPRHTVTLALGNVRSALPILVVGFVYALRAYTDLRTREFVDPFTLYLAFPVTVLGILAIFQIIPWRHFPSSFWHAAVLQFAGFFIARDALVGSALPPYNLLLAFALCNAIWIALADVVRSSLPPSGYLTA